MLPRHGDFDKSPREGESILVKSDGASHKSRKFIGARAPPTHTPPEIFFFSLPLSVYLPIDEKVALSRTGGEVGEGGGTRN